MSRGRKQEVRKRKKEVRGKGEERKKRDIDRVATKQHFKNSDTRNFDENILNFAKFCENNIVDFREIPNKFCEICAKFKINFAKFSQKI